MNCENCGKELPRQSKFCPFCGAKREELSEVGQLVKEAVEGKEQAYEKLYQMSYAQGFSVALQIVKNEQDALDLLQDAYISAFKNLKQLNSPEKFKSWFNHIVANKCRDWLRKRKPELFCEMNAEEDSQNFEDTLENDFIEFMPENQVDYKETKRLIKEILENLPDDQRLCVLMYYYDELPIGDIAETMQCSVGTVKSRLNYARKKIKEEVEALERKGTKLYGIAPIPFVIWMLREYEEQMSIHENLLQKEILPRVQHSSISPQYNVHPKSGRYIANTLAKKRVATRIIAGVVGAAVVMSGIVAFNHTRQGKEDGREKQRIERENQQEESLQNLMDNLDTEYLMKIGAFLPLFSDVGEISEYEMEKMTRTIFLDAYLYMNGISNGNEDCQNYGIIRSDEMKYDKGGGLYGKGTVICSETSLNQFWEAVNFVESPNLYVPALCDEHVCHISYQEGTYEVSFSGLGDIYEEKCELVEVKEDKKNTQIQVYYKTISSGYNLDDEIYKIMILKPKKNKLGYEIVSNYEDPVHFQLTDEEKSTIVSAVSYYDLKHKLAEDFAKRTEYQVDLRKDFGLQDLQKVAGYIGYESKQIGGEELDVEDIAMEGPQKKISKANAEILLEGTFHYSVSNEEDIEKVFEGDGSGNFILKGHYSGDADTVYSFIEAEQKEANEYHFYVSVRPWAGSDYQTSAIMDITAHKNGISEIAGFVFDKIDFYRSDKFSLQAWQEAYIANIDERESKNESSRELMYNIIYVDNDDIPELLTNSGYTAGGGYITTYYDNSIKEQYVANDGVSYIEKSGLFTSSAGRMDSFASGVYRLEEGNFEQIAKGKYGMLGKSYPENYSGDAQELYEYFWNDKKVTKEEYEEEFNKIYNGEIVDPYEDMCDAKSMIDRFVVFSVKKIKK